MDVTFPNCGREWARSALCAGPASANVRTGWRAVGSGTSKVCGATTFAVSLTPRGVLVHVAPRRDPQEYEDHEGNLVDDMLNRSIVGCKNVIRIFAWCMVFAILVSFLWCALMVCLGNLLINVVIFTGITLFIIFGASAWACSCPSPSSFVLRSSLLECLSGGHSKQWAFAVGSLGTAPSPP